MVTGGPKALHEQLLNTGLPAMRSRRRQKAHGTKLGSTWPGRGHWLVGEIIRFDEGRRNTRGYC